MSILDIFKRNENGIRLGKVTRELSISRIYSYKRAWRWRRVHFKGMFLRMGNELNPHIAIVGESGSGKSNLAKLISSRISEKGVPVAILDPHNEYIGIADRMHANVYDAARSGINIFDLDDMSIKERASELTGIFKRTFRLGDVQSYTLYKCISYCYRVLESRGRVPNIRDLLYCMKVFMRKASKAEQSVLSGLEKRISLLDNGAFTRSVSMSEVFRTNSLFLLSGLHTSESQSIYMEGFLRKAYSKMLSMGRSDTPRLYILIDEAAKIAGSAILDRIAAEGRKYGIGIIAISQMAKGISHTLRNNSSLFVSFYQREPEELNYISNFVAGGNELDRFTEVKKAIRSLPRGEAIVTGSRIRNPITADFDLCEEAQSSLSYSIDRLCSSGIRKQELINEMLRQGFLIEQIIDEIEKRVRNGMLRYYIASFNIPRYDGTWYIGDSRNGAEHDICIKMISDHLTSRGIANRIYNNSYGPDLIAIASRTAIEYETGSKALDESISMIEKRKKFYKSVMVIVNDKEYGRWQGSGACVVRISEFLKSDSPRLS